MCTHRLVIPEGLSESEPEYQVTVRWESLQGQVKTGRYERE
ncbi:hypothetical protein SAMN05216285_1228 [Natrinema salifodinae]|uniref:Uncharacterized protein n=1 Tax=Natrinema salifodinae TaxID=1202768 RepID=A0A1I0N0W3_9EURY|nr:hypothetical protein SAMN05216285_1228 [Natrinema salifodinae]